MENFKSKTSEDLANQPKYSNIQDNDKLIIDKNMNSNLENNTNSTFFKSLKEKLDIDKEADNHSDSSSEFNFNSKNKFVKKSIKQIKQN